MKKKKQKKNNVPVKFTPPKLESTPLKFCKDDQSRSVTVIGQKSTDQPQEEDLLAKRCKELVGVKDAELAENILFKGAQAIESILSPEESRNIIAQSLHNFEPKDAVEARLVVQATVAQTYGMKCMKRSGEADMLCHIEAMANLGVKLMRVHNETVETLNRYRRGGEQKVTVTHAVVAGQAIVNNFNGVGVPPENKGRTPCSEDYAMQKPEQTTITNVVSPQWPENQNADCTEAALRGRPKKASGE